jgi:hypothetical protein
LDVPTLLRQLAFADFSTRERMAAVAARELAPDELVALSQALDHPELCVRLGVIEVLWRAGHRESLGRLLTHAGQSTGDDRVFALRALVQLARPEDEALHAPLAAWLTSSDPFVSAQAQALARALGRPPIGADEPSASSGSEKPASPTRARYGEGGLVVALLAARTDADRIALVTEVERDGWMALAPVAQAALPQGNAAVVALLCRALIRTAETIPAATQQALYPMLEAAHARVGASHVAADALGDALLALQGSPESPALLLHLSAMSGADMAAALGRLHDRPPEQLAHKAPILVGLLKQRPALWPVVGPLLVDAAPHLPEEVLVELREVCETALAELRKGVALTPVTLLSLCWLQAELSAPGDPLCLPLRRALERLDPAEAALALAALCARLATEEAARALADLLGSPLAEAQAAAVDAARRWESPWVHLAVEGPAERPRVTLSTGYQDARGVPLVRADRFLVADGGELHALGPRGRPLRVEQTEHGACLCCAPPRALVLPDDGELRCPSSWQSHRPEARRLMPAPPRPRAPESTSWPPPPGPQELALMAPHFRRVMTANVFLLGESAGQAWTGSGVIVARDGGDVAIVTNRHVVAPHEASGLIVLSALTVSGEVFPVTTIWRASRGLDLAIVEGHVERADTLGVVALGSGGAAVGAPVVVVGNPLGKAWSYSLGSLSAVGDWEGVDGESVRMLETDAPAAPGSSGGGLFDADGHLLGLMVGEDRASTGVGLAISLEAIRAALARDGVRWRDQPLAGSG